MSAKFRFDSDKKPTKLIIEIDLEAPKPSSSGKTFVVASTHGNVSTGLELHGDTVKVGINAYIKPTDKKS